MALVLNANDQATVRVLGDEAKLILGSSGFTHIVGDIPAAGTNSVVMGTKRFEGRTGSVRRVGLKDDA